MVILSVKRLFTCMIENNILLTGNKIMAFGQSEWNDLILDWQKKINILDSIVPTNNTILKANNNNN